MAERVLLTEDDPRIRTAMRLVLEEEGYLVADVASGERAAELFETQAFDIVLVDLMLPGVSGFEVCERLREVSDVPIIIVTARTETAAVVRGLEAGADDYVTKPFVPQELLARIAASVRRARSRGSDPEGALTFGDLELFPSQGVVRRAGVDVRLSKTEFRLLCELASRPGDIFSREQLLELVWGYDYFGDGRLVDVQIRRLRTKIEIDPALPRRIVTVRGFGYRLQP